MDEPLFRVGADGIDVESVMADVRRAVDEKTRKGVYSDDVRKAVAARTDFAGLKDEDGFLLNYLDCLREAVFVDINDFEIREKRARLAWPVVALKRVIWKLLKFYTYRLWSQQNQSNGLLLSAVEGVESRYRRKVEELEKRIRDLEKKLGSGKQQGGTV